MIHEILPVGLLQCNCSILGDEQTREAIVVDPGANVDKIQALLERHHLRVKAIVITHAHIDHVAGAGKLRQLQGAPIFMHRADQTLLSHLDVQAQWIGLSAAPEVPEIDSDASDGLRLTLGPCELDVLHTPGHTQGSISILISQEHKVLAGDTLFRDSVGRTDLPGGDHRMLLKSIEAKLLVLPEETVVVPGHGALTSIGREKERNPFLRGV